MIRWLLSLLLVPHLAYAGELGRTSTETVFISITIGPKLVIKDFEQPTPWAIQSACLQASGLFTLMVDGKEVDTDTCAVLGNGVHDVFIVAK